jgi:hypothetical protein
MGFTSLKQYPLVQTTFLKIIAIAMAFTLMACSPKFNWREVRGVDAPFTVLLPAKPASISRETEMSGVKLRMQMTAADAGSISFAVGYTKVDDPAQYAGVLAAMKAGMLKNIQASSSKPLNGSATDIEATGQLQNGQAVKLVGRFVEHGGWVYQLIVIGKESDLTPLVIDTFLTSFKAS